MPEYSAPATLSFLIQQYVNNPESVPNILDLGAGSVPNVTPSQLNLVLVAEGVAPPVGSLGLYTVAPDQIWVIDSNSTATQIGGASGASSLSGLTDVVADYVRNNLGLTTGVLSLATGDYNVAVGMESAGAAMTGGKNTAIGCLSAANATSAHDNTVCGYESGQAITSGYDNTFIGSGAGVALQTGNSNTCIGYNSLTTGTAAVNQIAIGANAQCTADATIQIGDANTAFNNVYFGDSTPFIHADGTQLNLDVYLEPSTNVPSVVLTNQYLQIKLEGTVYYLATVTPGS